MPAHVAAAVPGRVVGQPRMLELLAAVNTGKRADSRRTWLAIVTVLVRHADWKTGAITVSHRAVGAEAGADCGRRPFSHDTVARVIADLITAGVLVCPDGLGGKSRRALGGAVNQCPTYFVTDPAAADDGADLRTPLSHVSETVPLGVTKAPYKGPIRPKFANFNSKAVPATGAERRIAAEWLRSRLHAGVVPNWRMAVMMTQHFDRGLSPEAVLRRVCHEPRGDTHRSLPTGAAERTAALARSSRGSSVADMLLRMIGGRLRLWRDVAAPAAPPAVPPPPAVQPPPPVRTAPGPASLALFAGLGLVAGSLRPRRAG